MAGRLTSLRVDWPRTCTHSNKKREQHALKNVRNDIPDTGTFTRYKLFEGIAVFGSMKMQSISSGVCAPSGGFGNKDQFTRTNLYSSSFEILTSSVKTETA